MLFSSSHHHSEMVQQSGLPIAQNILHLQWSRTNLFIARCVKASSGRISENVNCWGLQTGSVLNLLVSAAGGFWPVHCWVWALYHHRVHKCWYRLLFQTCIQRVTFHMSHVGNSSQESINSIALQTSAECMGWRATEHNTLLLTQSLQNAFSLHCNRKTSWKGPPGKPCKCFSKHCNQTRACQIQLCADILGLLLNEA